MMMDPAIQRILTDGLRREGWPAPARSLPSDRGGLTRGGITAESWGAYAHLGRVATAAELDAITDDRALEFYYQRYVLLPHFDQIRDVKLQALLIDWAFTSWFDDPVKALQSSLADRRCYLGTIDGIIGPQTVSALLLNRDPRGVYRDVLGARIKFYADLALDHYARALMDAQPTCQLANLRGWLNRCLEFLA